jgi:hypothetical protein
MIVFHPENQWFADKTENEISMVLRCFHGENDDVIFSRIGYYNDGKYIELTEKEIDFIIKNQVIDEYSIPIECSYYLKDGSRPLKKRDCYKCEYGNNGNKCFHHQKYYDKK